ncbi:MAG: ABC transporter permease [Streptococcaceae bacterium]|jgi:oligopeptide transport system permease protein|nr:ABC transporter permease [Streptococcaceae bacterium]
MENKVQDFSLVGAKDSSSSEYISKPALSMFQDAVRRFKQNKVAVVFLILLIASILFALISTFFVTNAKANNFSTTTQAYSYLSPGSPNFILGTDQYGRSLALRTIVGFRISLIIAFSAAAIDLVIGVTYGLISGWVGGKTDLVMQRIIEIITSIPNLVIVTLLSLVMGQSIVSIILAIGLFAWTGMARQVRSMVLTYKERDFILASKTLGQSTWKIALKHLLPNVSGVIIVQLMFDIPSMILYEAVLSQINLGVKPPTASLGTLISDGIANIQTYSYLLIIPALVLSLLSLAFIFVGDGLNDAFDPRASED